MFLKNLTRRDLCFLVGKRAAKLSREESANAWQFLSGWVESLGDADVPKFTNLIDGMRQATIVARHSEKNSP